LQEKQTMSVQAAFKNITLGFSMLLVIAPATWAAMPAPGSVAPDFALKSSSGKNLRLSEHRGEVVLLNFWATWCGPCRQELPLLNRIHEQYRKVGLTLLGVNIDDRADSGQAMARKLGITFPILFDPGKQVSRRYDVDAMPSTLLIDRSGTVRYIHRGYLPGYEKTYEAQIRELLKQ
jgi:peroxiredoxin